MKKSFKFHRQYNVKAAQQRLFAILPYWVAGLLTGIVATFYARMFSYAETFALEIFKSAGLFSLLIVPALFVSSWFLVEKYAPHANGSGIPQLMAAAAISGKDDQNIFIEKLLGFRIIIIKMLSSLLGVLGGGAIGREGPTLQMAGSIFHLTEKFFKWDSLAKNKHIMILAGGASGLAAAFNTPLGGIVYVVEELSKTHLSHFRTGVLHAVIVAGLISQLILGPYLYFGYPKIEPFQAGQVGMLIALSVVIAFISTFFCYCLKKIVIYRAGINSSTKKAILAAFFGFIFAAFALYASPAVMGPGKELITDLLFRGRIAGAIDLIARLFGSIVTYAAGGAGGIFAPTLSIGGAAASYIESLLGSNLGPIAVLIGMTAALSALTQSPFTSFVLILEMTDRHAAIFPLMIAALLGHSVSKILMKHSFYEFVCSRILSSHHSAESETEV